ncbi:YfiT family bacillithiol transferase [Marinococcus sp. PL1-022]|uniref:YfiT family bacillithiol transferase n=1 Tax=Marinococcus sp. PL1-022 TaxID=3095363 RepID=UPI0029C5EC32|nr:putative metal-dependent hydrolase [Marinococcus sp. PL1-022]MDX6151888.1 putative metal-dependent hydrolase [Marinococcus sp. PL1-022]
MDKYRFPIGTFEWPKTINAEQRKEWTATLSNAPSLYREEVEHLTKQQLNTPYREGGWSIRQVVHHVPDSHLHGYIRFKQALTEEDPEIKPYDQTVWAELADSSGEIEASLKLLESLHQRWSLLLNGLQEDDWLRTFRHPESGRFTLGEAASLYAWHSRHHLSHITFLKERMGWS